MRALLLPVFAMLILAAAIRTFEAVPLETVSETTANASIGDLNGDGHLDIVLAKGRHWPLADVVLFGDGKGHFKPGPPLPNKPDRSYSAPLADLDGDGSLDMVISNDRPDPKIVLLNDGKGNFRMGGTFGDPNWSTRNVVLADFNGDGFPDIAVANRPGPAQVCFNAGLFQDGHAHFKCKPFAPETSSSILAADMNGDGKIDIVLPCRDDCPSQIYFNDGKGNFPTKKPFGPVSSTRAIAIADFDGDGKPDIAACHEQAGLYIYFGNGESLKIADKDALPYSMITADLNKDGHPDMIVGFVNAPGAIYFNDGTGKKFARIPFGDSKGATYGFAVADLDGDGWPDIVAARSDAPSLVFFSKPGKR
jgi:hypothetical protein